MTLSFASTSELLKNRDMDTDADTPQGMGLLPPRRLSAAACLPLSSTVILHGIASAHAPVMSTCLFVTATPPDDIRDRTDNLLNSTFRRC